jgi:iron complex transport system substrate-binding protein
LIPDSASSFEIDEQVRQLQQEPALYLLDSATLESLEPDLILTQTLCNVCAVAQSEVEKVASRLKQRPQIVNLEPTRFSDLYGCIRQVAEAAQCSDVGEKCIVELQTRVEQVSSRSPIVQHRPCAAILEWIDPLYSAGHWNPELIELAGGHEMIGLPGQRSRTIAWNELTIASPQVLVIACCGFSIERAMRDIHILTSNPNWNSLPCVQNNRVAVVDGSAYFNRPGPRLVDSLELVAHILNPQLHPLPSGIFPPKWLTS